MTQAAPPPPPESFGSALAEIDVTLSAEQLLQCGQFLDLLYEANQKFNLTAIREKADAWEKHILDSLTLLPILGALVEGRMGAGESDDVWGGAGKAEAVTVADLGSGGGLPAIPLAICLPGVEFSLVEATGKKAVFLGECVEPYLGGGALL